jgi:hypothetical protein
MHGLIKYIKELKATQNSGLGQVANAHPEGFLPGRSCRCFVNDREVLIRETEQQPDQI